MAKETGASGGEAPEDTALEGTALEDTALEDRAEGLAEAARALAEKAEALAHNLGETASAAGGEAAGDAAGQAAQQAAQAAAGGPSVVFGLTVFVLAIFVGYHVVWRVTPALHSPLMAVTNAVSSVIVVGALIAAGPAGLSFSQSLGLVAITLASVNIFGGFIVTQRMLSMFTKKK